MATEIATAFPLPEITEAAAPPRRAPALQVWRNVWPKVAAVGLALAAWQVVVWSGWKPDYVLPGPAAVLGRLAEDLRHADFYVGVAITLRRALIGYAIAVAIGSATGLLSGVDHVQPLLVRVGQVMGAKGLGLYRHVILPAALPSFVGGLKQGWAFAWRSLMAGELLVIVNHQGSLGQQLQFARDLADAEQLLALMIVIFVIGVVIDSLFGNLDRAIRQRWGLGGEA